MLRRIKIISGEVEVEAELNESMTARLIWDALPIEARANLWGEEIYFSIPVVAEEEKDSKSVVNAGDLGYWPPGRAFCIFFGPTPASKGAEIRAASPVNIVGRLISDPKVFLKISSNDRIRIEKA